MKKSKIKNCPHLEKLQEQEHAQTEAYKKMLSETIKETYLNAKKLGIIENQTELSQLFGCSQPRVSNILKGSVEQFTIGKLLGFCIKLGISPNLQVKPLRIVKPDTRKALNEIKEQDMVA